MKNNSVFVKTFACLFTASLVVGGYVQTAERFAPKKVDFTAFKNASANIEFLAQDRTAKSPGDFAKHDEDVTSGIVKTIEKEVKQKIRVTRVAMRPKAPKFEKSFEATEVVAKNWNEIKPQISGVEFKVEEAKIAAFSLNEVPAEFEINNKELINHYGFSVEALRYETFSNVVLATYEVPESAVVASSEVINDEVNTAQASTTTNIVEDITPAKEEVAVAPVTATTPEVNTQVESAEEIEAARIATTENPVNDDLVVFDYSKKEDPKAETKVVAGKKMFDAPLSSSVREAIEREVHKSGSTVVNTQPPRKSQSLFADNNDGNEDIDLEKVMNDADSVVYDYSAQKQASVSKKDATAAAISAFTAPVEPAVTTQAEFTIRAKEINLSSQKVRTLGGFEFIPDYDRAERMAESLGEVKLAYSLTGDMSTQTGVVEAQGMIPTRVELNLKNGGMDIPLLNEGSIQKFLQKKGLDIFGNLFMTAIDSSVVDVEIDSDYQAKLYFNEKFKVVDQDQASYVLFLGVKNGNMAVRYLLDNKESAQKIVYIGEGEMYFENPEFVESARELYTFTTRSLLGRKVKELNINAADVKIYDSNVVSKKKTLNSYEIKTPAMVDNSRKYLEFKHLGNPLYVGTANTKEIEIPGDDFIGRVMQANQLSSLGERCMVQINLTKELRDFKVSGKNRAGEMFVEPSFLDNDGNFSRDNSELAEKIFITGDLEGIFSARLDYTDGSTEFLKSYCREGDYIIEQL